MGNEHPRPLDDIRQYANKPIPEVDPGDLRAVYEFVCERVAKAGGRSMGVGLSVYEQLCSPGANTLMVWYRASLLQLCAQMLGQSIPESELQSMPADAPVPFREVPEGLREDLNQPALPGYVFEVFAKFPITGIPAEGMQGLPMDFGNLIAELERGRAGKDTAKG
ncbi:MAG TPA: hypothetical protein VMT75_12515 [Candidatus Saccharimonadales bacterium]|nr:hypothetical protein [Candidatus Saccharimonadales bacterium]